MFSVTCREKTGPQFGSIAAIALARTVGGVAEYSEKWLTPEDIAVELCVSLSTVYKWSRRGAPDFPKAVRLPNGTLRVRWSEFLRWLDGRQR